MVQRQETYLARAFLIVREYAESHANPVGFFRYRRKRFGYHFTVTQIRIFLQDMTIMEYFLNGESTSAGLPTFRGIESPSHELHARP